MSSDITLVLDPEAVGGINARKVMVAVPLMYLFMVPTFLPRPTTSSICWGCSKAPRSQEKGSATWADACISMELLLCSVWTSCRVMCLVQWYLGSCWWWWFWPTATPFWGRRGNATTISVCCCFMGCWRCGTWRRCSSSFSIPFDRLYSYLYIFYVIWMLENKEIQDILPFLWLFRYNGGRFIGRMIVNRW